MILTFDDGYEDAYSDALPALLAHHYRGVFYIITGMIGGNYMTWRQVRKLAQDGMQVASHTIHHVNIGQPPAWTSTQNELLVSKETLEAQLKQPIQFFCYPTGEPFHHDPIYEQQAVLADLFKDGYVAATLDPFSYEVNFRFWSGDALLGFLLKGMDDPNILTKLQRIDEAVGIAA